MERHGGRSAGRCEERSGASHPGFLHGLEEVEEEEEEEEGEEEEEEEGEEEDEKEREIQHRRVEVRERGGRRSRGRQERGKRKDRNSDECVSLLLDLGFWRRGSLLCLEEKAGGGERGEKERERKREGRGGKGRR